MIRFSKSFKYKQIHITVAIIAAVMCFFISCAEKTEQVEAIIDRAKTPSLRATEVSTVVSDSGVTRYRMNTPEWLIYDRAEVPYWDFPQGIHLEKFDTALNVDAEIKSNYAIYYDKKRLWDLRDSVKAVNLEGEQFECNQLFWNEVSERVYSDSMIRITQKDKIIIGYGFESNQSLTRYVIRKPEGVFPLEE
ncbi:MAG: LPS export ABC transporter periplasmic protein LptC [Prevotellaceae bacterium]|jgi:LPS export ABC transporter protein LptC|nr:LPS export ABC transporter periplasmic protein LptC [Prevotellaceae bacterium]